MNITKLIVSRFLDCGGIKLKMGEMIIRKAILLSIFISCAFAQCPISYEVLYSIATAESHPKRKVGYPFIISFNNKRDFASFEKSYKKGDYIKLDNRSLDCKNQVKCKEILSHLIKQGATNLDLGAFGFNYRYVTSKDLGFYFRLKDSYLKACDILVNLKEKYGWSLETIAKYHSSTQKYNQRYQNKLLQIYSKNIAQKPLKTQKIGYLANDR